MYTICYLHLYKTEKYPCGFHPGNESTELIRLNIPLLLDRALLRLTFVMIGESSGEAIRSGAVEHRLRPGVSKPLELPDWIGLDANNWRCHIIMSYL